MVNLVPARAAINSSRTLSDLPRRFLLARQSLPCVPLDDRIGREQKRPRVLHRDRGGGIAETRRPVIHEGEVPHDVGRKPRPATREVAIAEPLEIVTPVADKRPLDTFSRTAFGTAARIGASGRIRPRTPPSRRHRKVCPPPETCASRTAGRRSDRKGEHLFPRVSPSAITPRRPAGIRLLESQDFVEELVYSSSTESSSPGCCP